jgi:hypothetical protein
VRAVRVTAAATMAMAAFEEAIFSEVILEYSLAWWSSVGEAPTHAG